MRIDDQTTRQQKSVAISGVMPIAQRSNTFHEIHVVTAKERRRLIWGAQAWDSLPLRLFDFTEEES
jgi:hypothetical protein